ncbi:hypothetical protein Trydic_g3915 [Trypoxylus dichotomus]
MADLLDLTITPIEVPREDVIYAIEVSIKTLPEEEEVGEITSTTQLMLKLAKPLRSNLSREKRRSIIELMKNKDNTTISASQGIRPVLWTQGSV